MICKDVAFDPPWRGETLNVSSGQSELSLHEEITESTARFDQVLLIVGIDTVRSGCRRLERDERCTGLSAFSTRIYDTS